jgi:UDP:flavonoid glycosyltransferase YjiC (YdhE family)
MRILIIAPGSRGDLQPYLALGKGLKDAGHTVRLVTHEDFEELVNSVGVEFWPIAGKVTDIAQSSEMQARLEKGRFLSVISLMAKEAQRGSLNLANAGLAACKDVDLVLAGIGGLFTGVALAEKFRLPFIQTYYIPFTPTRAYPSFLIPPLPFTPGKGFNRYSYQLARQMIWQGFHSADRIARKKVLKISPSPFFGPFNSEVLQGLPILYGYSPVVIPPPDDWGEDMHVTGYWFLDHEEDFKPPQELADFLRTGSNPIFIGFGSMSSRRPEENTKMVLAALSEAKQRAVLLSGWGGLQKTNLPDSVFMLDSVSVPFTWLFPRMTVVVHHGGAGTTSAGLRAGVPSIITPFFGDQPFWGRRVAELGVGPEPIFQKKLTASKLAAAIKIAVSDESMRQKSAKLGEKIRAEDGVTKAVEVIEKVFDNETSR